MRILSFYLLLILLMFNGCSEKSEIAEFNKPAIYWYKQMLENIHNRDLEAADDFFTSLQSEHINSPLLPEAMLVLAKAHMDAEEYLLAEFYLDEYIKRFGTEKNIDYAKHMKIKANFLAFRLTFRDQQLLLDTIRQAEQFILENPYSSYRPIVDTMLLKMHLANIYLNREIADLYTRLDKPEAAKAYADRVPHEWLKNILMTEPEMSWYRQMFNW